MEGKECECEANVRLPVTRRLTTDTLPPAGPSQPPQLTHPRPSSLGDCLARIQGRRNPDRHRYQIGSCQAVRYASAGACRKLEGREGRRRCQDGAGWPRTVSPCKIRTWVTPVSDMVRLLASRSELFFGDTTSLLGSMDLRTGKVLYAYPQQTCTTSHVLPLWMPDTSHSEKNTIGMVSLASDATLRLHSTSSPPIEAKHNVTKGVILGGIPGIGLGNPVFGGYLHTWHPDENGSDAGSDDEDVQGDVWDDMAVVDDVSDGSDSDEDMEEQVKKKRKAQTKPKPRED